MSGNYPKNLMNIAVNVDEVFQPIAQDLQEQSQYQFVYYWSYVKIEEMIKKLSQGKLHTEWYKKQGPCYYAGIFTAWLWENCPGLKNNELDEEDIWELLLKKHTQIHAKSGTLRFVYNKDSSIDKWLRRHTSEPEVTSGVETVFKLALKVVSQDYDFGVELIEEEDEVMEQEVRDEYGNPD